MARTKNCYKSVLRKFLEYIDGIEYPPGHDIPQARLVAITPEELVRYLNFKAYGTPSPSEADRPTIGRANSLWYIKKAISGCLPNKHIPWNDIARAGNPTRSIQVNQMIKDVQKFECRGQGKPSQARRPMKEHEFRALLDRCRESDNPIVKYGVPAVLCFMFHLIGRLDDSCSWQRTNFRAHDVHGDKCAKVRLAWSKNVMEERDAPWQHLFGCMDPSFCNIVNLSLWLEVFLGSNVGAGNRPHVFCFSDDMDVERAAAKAKTTVYSILKPILREMGHEDVDLFHEDGPLGSHSIRKYASTWVRSNGISKDDKDYRGRWKHRRVSDIYDDTQLDWIDAKVAQELCIGGVCHYKVVDDGVTGDWICQNISPNITAVYGPQLGKLFGRALLWIAYSDRSHLLPPAMLDRIKTAYNEVSTTPDNEPPVVKVLQHVSGREAQVFVQDVEANPQDPEDVAANPGLAANPPMHRVHGGGNHFYDLPAMLNTLLAQGNRHQRSLTDLQGSFERMKITQQRTNTTLNGLVNRIDRNPVNMIRRQATQQQRRNQAQPPHVQARNTTSNATLMPNPRNLEQLWEEYEIGSGGRKAAKLFTRQERGTCRFKYSRRKIVWDLIASLVRAGRTAPAVIDSIYAAYGPISVTQIINRVREDKKHHRLPATLRV